MRHTLLLALLISATSNASASPAIIGYAKALDGDSLQIGSRKVRLFGVDAPEWEQRCKRDDQNWSCGEEAAAKLADLVRGREVWCTVVNTDEYDRAVSRCMIGRTDLNAAMVEGGYATAYRHYSMAYVPMEERAKMAKRGLWSGTFTNPSDWRNAERKRDAVVERRPSIGRSSRATPAFRRGCVIKGNQGSNGWIYHLPGMPYYARTRAEQIFCSEADAQAAGYRRAIVK